MDKIVGDQVVLSSKEVRKPVAARYAYTMNPADANLYNVDGLPAGPPSEPTTEKKRSVRVSRRHRFQRHA